MRVRLLSDTQDPSGDTEDVIPAGTILEVSDLTVETLDGAVAFAVTADQVEPLPLTLGDLGFVVENTGDGCSHYWTLLDDGREVIVTNLSGDNLPQEGEPVLVGIYSDGEDSNLCSYLNETLATTAIRGIMARIPT